MPQHPYTHGGEAPDPQRYILVKTKEGSYYRLRRGLGKPARLNSSFQQSAEGMKQSSPAARRLKRCLAEALRGLEAGRLIARLGARLKEALRRDGRFHFGCFAGYDFQREHPLDRLLAAAYRVRAAGGEACLSVPLYRGAVKQKSALVSHYYFELVLVWGDAGRDDGLRLDCVSSPLYAFGVDTAPSCNLSLVLPGDGAPWMLLLKVSCLEGNELAHHPRHYGMRVVAVGREGNGQ